MGLSILLRVFRIFTIFPLFALGNENSSVAYALFRARWMEDFTLLSVLFTEQSDDRGEWKCNYRKKSVHVGYSSRGTETHIVIYIARLERDGKCVEGKIREKGRSGSNASDLFDWCTSVFPQSGIFALFLLRYTARWPIRPSAIYTPLALLHPIRLTSGRDTRYVPVLLRERSNHKFRSSTRTLVSHGKRSITSLHQESRKKILKEIY